MIHGLQTGKADANADGRITLEELYNYVHNQVVNATPKQNPRKWSFNQEGEIVVGKNPYFIVKPVELPAELQAALNSPYADVRAGAVRTVAKYLRDSQADLALRAQGELQRLTNDDSRSVSSAAKKGLRAYEAQVKAETELSEQQRLAVQKRIEEDSFVKEKAEAEQFASGEAEVERVAREKAEQERVKIERLTREEAEAKRLTQEKAEAERREAVKAEAERVALEKAEQERLKTERLTRKKAEAERLAQEKAESERLAAVKAEQERLKTERLTREEAEA